MIIYFFNSLRCKETKTSRGESVNDIYIPEAEVGTAIDQLSESEAELLLMTRPNNNHSLGPVIREVSP